jgi:protein-S-isoprenylcysteine O-methyltransferase Ste14
MTNRIEGKTSRYTNISRQFMINIGNYLYLYRGNTVFFMVIFVLIISTKPMFIFERPFLDNCMDGVGFVVAIIGQITRSLVMSNNYTKIGGRGKKIRCRVNRLVQVGLFAHSRNPLYLGNILIIMGLGIIYNSIWGYILTYSFFLFGYLAIVMAEETFLKTKFGPEYEAYCKRVPRLIPQFAGIRKTFRSGGFNCLRFLRKEYNVICIWVR